MKKLIVAGVLGVLSMASASADTVYFAYKGFFDEYSNTYKPNTGLSGYFIADDLNQDGAYSKDELSSISFGALQIGNGCEVVPDVYYISYCVKDFSYSASDGLTLDAYDYASVEYNAHYITVKAGESYENLNYGYNSSRLTHWTWTPETQFWVSTSPIPEPATYAMLGLGLSTLMLARRRRS